MHRDRLACVWEGVLMRIILIAAMLAGAALGQDAAALLPIVTAPVGTPIISLGLYAFDSDLTDASGNGYHGTWVSDIGGTNIFVSGKYGMAASVASRNGIQLGSARRVDAENVHTICGWVYKNGIDVNVKWFIAQPYTNTWSPPYVNCALYTINSTNALARVGVGVASSIGSVPTNTWTHLASVYDATTIRLYVDGVEAAITSSSQTMLSNPSQPIGVGRTGSIPIAESFVGLVDDVRIYDRALSPANIRRIMTGQDVAPIEELQ